MVTLKIEDVKELSMDLKEPESELKPKIKFKSRYVKS